MAFIETPRFPVSVGWGTSGGPGYNTSVIVLNSGHEQRNANWEYSRGMWNVATGVKSQATLEDLISFFHAAQGKLNGFRYKDRYDFKSVTTDLTPSNIDQTIATADGATIDFQLIKTYTQGSTTKTRIISKPVSGTVLVSVDSVAQTESVDYTLDTTTGIITFLSAAVPTNGQIIKAGYEFDVPCRFDTDTLSTSIDTYKAGGAEVPIVEIRI